MDDFNIDDFDKKTPDEPASEEDDSLIPWDDSGETDISHTPLNLGDTPAPTSSPAPAQKPLNSPLKAEASEKIVSTDRITGVKTFFTKLHAGAIDFINDQVNNWLKNNPDVVVKSTNTTTGMVVSKKTEPNLIITIWY